LWVRSFEDLRRSASEAPDAPPIGDDARRDAHGDYPSGPAKPGHAQGNPRRCPTAAKRNDDRIGWRVELRPKLERGQYVTDDGTRVSTPSRNPARRTEAARVGPGAKHRPRQPELRTRPDDVIGRTRRRGRDRETRVGIRLRKLRQYDAVAEPMRVEGSGETMRGPRAADRDKDRVGRRAREQKLKTADLVATRSVFAFEPQRVDAGYIRHAARAARKCADDPLGGAPQAPDAEFYKTLAKALEEIAAGMERLAKPE